MARTPHGQAFLVDHTGTNRLTREQADAIAEAAEGVEIYFTRVGFDYQPA